MDLSDRTGSGTGGGTGRQGDGRVMVLKYWFSGNYFRRYPSHILVETCISFLLMMLISHSFHHVTISL